VEPNQDNKKCNLFIIDRKENIDDPQFYRLEIEFLSSQGNLQGTVWIETR
jgi:hypothetical protein